MRNCIYKLFKNEKNKGNCKGQFRLEQLKPFHLFFVLHSHPTRYRSFNAFETYTRAIKMY